MVVSPSDNITGQPERESTQETKLNIAVCIRPWPKDATPHRLLLTGRRSYGGLSCYRVSGGDYLHGAARPRAGCPLPDLAGQLTLDLA